MRKRLFRVSNLIFPDFFFTGREGGGIEVCVSVRARVPNGDVCSTSMHILNSTIKFIKTLNLFKNLKVLDDTALVLPL